MSAEKTVLQVGLVTVWGTVTVGTWINGPSSLNKILGFTPDTLPFILLAPVVGLVVALLLFLLVVLSIVFAGKQSNSAYEKAGRVSNLYSSVTGNAKPAAVDRDPYFEPAPTKPSEIYSEYDSMRAALAAHVRNGDDAMPKAEQLKRYTELGGVPRDYLYQSPRRLRKVKGRAVAAARPAE